ATSALAEYADKMKAAMPAMPPEAQNMFQNLKVDVKTDKTGKTEVIKGIKTEEMIVTMAMEMPGPMPAMGITIEMHLWATTPDEPMTDMTTDLVELSTEPIPDSVFQVPAGYQAAKIEELIQLTSPARPQPPHQ